MEFAIVRFPGSNCDRDCEHVVTRVLGERARFVWHQDRDLGDADCVIVPGGFSYGDYLRAGAVAKLSPVMESVAGFAAGGGPVIGICNGFQILLECGLLPGAMQRNRSLEFVCKQVNLRVATGRTAFTRGLDVGAVLRIPIAHAEGNYTLHDGQLEELRGRDQIVFEYCAPDGEVTELANPNGSVGNIAGVCNERGNVLGMMPHPERAAEAALGSTDGLALFRSAVDAVAG
jgi:phosphoribosylformylglycinamidine synthase